MIERVHGFIGDDPQRLKSVGPRGQDKRDLAKSEETELGVFPRFTLGSVVSSSQPHLIPAWRTGHGVAPQHQAQTPLYTPPLN